MDTSKWIEFVVFLAVAYWVVLRPLGRWMQRKGRSLEKGDDDASR